MSQSKLHLTITKINTSYSVEMRDQHCNYAWVYEPSVKQAMQYALYWHEMTEQRHETNQLHAKAVMEMNKLDKEAGILTGNYDGLD